MTLWRSLFLVMLAGWLSGCGINNIPTYDEQVKAAWSQVENQYQRRADLIPNLVNTVKGYASHERGAGGRDRGEGQGGVHPGGWQHTQ